MTPAAENNLAGWLGLGWVIGGVIVLGLRPRLTRNLSKEGQRRFDAIAAAALTYVCYTLSALLADAPLPEFFREHLFDGFAPAALVGLLVIAFPREHPRAAFPRIRQPNAVMAVFYMVSGLIFTLVAATAVFSSGSNQFNKSLVVCGLLGASISTYAYIVAVLADTGADPALGSPWSIFWWFKKRPGKGAGQAPAAPQAVVLGTDASPDAGRGQAPGRAQASGEPPSGGSDPERSRQPGH